MPDKKKGGFALVISVGGKPPKKPEDTADSNVKKAPIPEAMTYGDTSWREHPLHGKEGYEETSKGFGDPTRPFGREMPPGGPLIEPLSNQPAGEGKQVNLKEPKEQMDFLFDAGGKLEPNIDAEKQRELSQALAESGPERPKGAVPNMEDPNTLQEGEESPEPELPPKPGQETFPSFLEGLQNRLGVGAAKPVSPDQRPTGSWMSPSSTQRLATNQPPKNVFTLSEDVFEVAWQLLKAEWDTERGEFTNPTPSVDALRENLMAALNSPPTEDEDDPLTAPTNPRPNSPTPMGQEDMVREGGDDLDARLTQIAAELGRRAENKPGVTPDSAGDNPMFRYLRPELEQMQADTESEIGRRDENKEARRAVRRGV